MKHPFVSTLVLNLTAIFALSFHSAGARLTDVLSKASNLLSWESESGWFAVETELQIDFTAYVSDTTNNMPGFFFPKMGEKYGWAPRLEVANNAFFGDRVSTFFKGRWDYGVHPRSAFYENDAVEIRVDELFVKIRVTDESLTMKAGQFTPLIGGFFGRQHNWESALISYPAAYESVLSTSDRFIPANTRDFANRANEAENEIAWFPVLWAPLYPRGIAAEGSVGTANYSINLLNSNISSRGATWNRNDWSSPTLAGRLGYSPSPAWEIGFSFAHGSYLIENIEGAPLPTGSTRDAFKQRTLGLDMRYSLRRWKFFYEAWYSTIETPNVNGTPAVYSTFIEAQYDLNARTTLSTRLNLETYNRLTDPSTGEKLKWDNTLFRADIGAAYRFSRFLQGRMQYSFQRQDADFQNAQHFVATELSLRL